MDVNAELFDIFIQETTEHLDALDEALLVLEKDTENQEEINRIFRSFHTIKSSTAFMGYAKAAQMVHKIEDLVQDIREGKRKLTPEMCSFMLKCRDSLSSFIEDIAKGREVDEGVFLNFTDQLAQIKATGTVESVSEKQTDPALFSQTFGHVSKPEERKDTALIKVKLSPSDFQTVRAWMVFNEIDKMAEYVWSSPAKATTDKMLEGSFILTSEELLIQCVPHFDLEAISEAIMGITEIESVTVIQAPETVVKRPVGVMAVESDDSATLSQYTVFLLDQTMSCKSIIDGFVENLHDISRVWDLYRSLHSIKGLLGYVNRMDLFDYVGVMEKLLKKQINDNEADKLNALGLIAQALEIMEMVFTSSEAHGTAEIQLLQEQMSSMLTDIVLPVAETKVKAEVQAVSPAAAKSVEPAAARSAEPAGAISKKEPEKVPEKAHADTKAQNYIRIPEIKVDNLVDLLGELLILQSLHRQDISAVTENESNADSKIINNLMRMERITKEIQTISMSLRMVSLKQTLQKLQRVGRDTAQEVNKEVLTIIEGEETEIDRSVVEKIQDPLLHMVRNSISHGIENSDERLAAGKPAAGKVTISAYNKRGNVYIEVTDDGKGLNANTIYNKALEKGLIDPDKNYTVDEIYHFIYLPGFSTAESVNSLSGRGVGMNVVETEVRKIGGKVDIRNREGEGCTFILKIPINLATINGTIVEIGNQKFIIPTINVKQILKPQEKQFVLVNGRKKMIMVREDTIQIVPTNNLLDIDIEKTKTVLNEGIIVVIENEQKYKALPVDRVLGKQEIVLKPLGNEFRQYSYLTGATILGDGKVSLILDIDAIFKITEECFEL